MSERPSQDRAALPKFIPPELATLVGNAPDGDAWFHEIKLDGYRTAARIEGGKVRLLAHTGLDWTARFRPIATALASLPVKTAYLDGEVAVHGPDGVTSFAALQDALSKGGAADLVYFAFDFLHLDGLDLTPLPLIERKAALKKLLGRRRGAGPIRCYRPRPGPGRGLLQPRLQTRAGGHRQQARQIALWGAQNQRMAQGEMFAAAGNGHWGLAGFRQAGPQPEISLAGLLRPDGPARVCRQGGNWVLPEAGT